MKIIHSSDWHLGQYFMGKSRQKEHQGFLNWLVEQVLEHEVDAVIVAGDIFDTGAPPSYARELYHKFVIDFSEATNKAVPLVIVAGNHDSVAMLEETSDLLAHFNTHVISSANENTYEQQLLPVTGAAGEIKGIICAVPFLRARDLVGSHSGSTGKEKQRDVQDAIKQHYQVLYSKALGLRDVNDSKIPIIMTGHLTVVGARTSESVRDIYIGTLEAFSASSFPSADYIALGHIHKQQQIKGNGNIYYSGSPIPLSFDELNQKKSVQVVEFDEAGVTVDAIDVPVFQQLYKIKGNLEEISTKLSELKGGRDGSAYCSESNGDLSETIWLEVEVEEQDYLEDLQKRIEELVVDSNIEVLCLKRSRNRKGLSLVAESSERLQELKASEVFEKRLSLEPDGIDDALKSRLQQMFKEALLQAEQGDKL
ncbi:MULTISPECIES: exonuclease subunit SbcD [unclassified Oleiphilus]|uniref:exonuclease subunit SbcD n=6 Tax=Oleiphilus TaxID=141450 RepID=UPI0008384EFB|nr:MULTISPECIES: exonuclease subunit SbcD [unclassified Oleiphilus]